MNAIDDGCRFHVALFLDDNGHDVGCGEVLDDKLGCGGVDIVVAPKQLFDVDIEDTRNSADSLESNVGDDISSFNAWNTREVVNQDSGVRFSYCTG